MNDFRYDVDKLTQEQLKDKIKNCKNNFNLLNNSSGRLSVLRLIKEYENRLDGNR